MKRSCAFSPILVAAASACVLSACTQPNSTIYTGTATIIGVDVSQSASQIPQGTLGYKRAELGIIPTDLGQCYADEDKRLHCPDGITAKNSPDVLMELYYPGIFTNGGIYQRLAVGTDAVKQPGAAALFAKAPDGSIDPNAAAVMSQATIAGQQDAIDLQSAAERVTACASTNGALDTAKLGKIADAVSPVIESNTINSIKQTTDAAGLALRLKLYQQATHAMSTAIKNDVTLCQ
jgi:hypothetical protein